MMSDRTRYWRAQSTDMRYRYRSAGGTSGSGAPSSVCCTHRIQSNQCAGSPVTTRGAKMAGRTVFPTPLSVAVARTMLKGLPVCVVTMEATSHPATSRLPLNGSS